MGRIRGSLWCAALALLVGPSLAAPADEAEQLLAEGRLHQAESLLRACVEAAAPDADPAVLRRCWALRAQAALQAGRPADAEAALRRALPGASEAERAALRLDEGRAALAQGRPEAAREAWSEAARSPWPALAQRARLHLAALAEPAERLSAWRALLPELGEARLLLQLAEQAAAAQPRLAAQALQRALQQPGLSARERAEAWTQEAALHEAGGEREAALRLSQQALALLPTLPEAQQADLRVHLSWRVARLQDGAARLAGLQRAVAQLEAVRDDWPLQQADGRSSHAALFEPLYMALVDALTQRAAASQGEARQRWLRQARDALEQLYQAELQDYLGDRCEVDAVKGRADARQLPAGSAAVYPLLLADRVALLVEDAGGLELLAAPEADSQRLRAAATTLAARLRERAPGFLSAARTLHDGLLQPIEPWLTQRGAHTLVWVNAGALRLVPMGALFDGQRHALERYEMVSVLGMSMTNTEAPTGRRSDALLAGAGRFGAVAERLASETWAQPLRRQLLGVEAEAPGASRSLQATRLREALELPGVGEEIDSLRKLMPGVALQDAGFTVQSFSGAVQQGGRRVVHIASHGVFGGSAASSYLLAYDDLLTLDTLQTLLRSDASRRQPIELLTLSACQTAEGNERAPLGLSGAALKARARAVLGTLWPVDDAATVRLMQAFYREWLAQPEAGKAAALRSAQLALLRNRDTRHPYYWAPFALIGNWR